MSEDALWFYEQDGEQKGPVEEAELLELLGQGDIQSDTLVWREGIEDWLPLEASGIPGAKKQPPMIPARQESEAPMVPDLRPQWVPREAAIRAGFKPGLGSILGRGWEQLKDDFWGYVLACLIVVVLYSAISQLYVTMFFMLFPCTAGLSWFLLLRKRGHKVAYDALFEGFRRRFGSLALLNLIVTGVQTVILLLALGAGFGVFLGLGLVGEVTYESLFEDVNPTQWLIISAIGFVLLLLTLIPSLLLNMTGSFAMMLILDCEASLSLAWSLSWQVVKKWWFRMCLYLLVMQLLVNLGLLAFYVGVFVTTAWICIAWIHLYEDAFGDDDSDQVVNR